MDENTKAKAHIKLDLMKDYIGYPKEIFNNTALEEVYEGLEITDNTFFLNAINMSKWSTNKSFKKLREKVDKTDWKRHANPAIVNAFYNSIENSMQFPAGILQVCSFLITPKSEFRNYFPPFITANLKKCYSISLFSKMGDKGEGGVKNLKKWVISIMDVP